MPPPKQDEEEQEGEEEEEGMVLLRFAANDLQTAIEDDAEIEEDEEPRRNRFERDECIFNPNANPLRNAIWGDWVQVDKMLSSPSRV